MLLSQTQSPRRTKETKATKECNWLDGVEDMEELHKREIGIGIVLENGIVLDNTIVLKATRAAPTKNVTPIGFPDSDLSALPST